ncbi:MULTISPECIES: N-acetyltransferase [unclassified Roseitalea]|uniref:GNAT family N-acetyltransferase n=1 Tax=unclassified Roseitalea TaxID=2639107 RepID=UPI00273F89E8|nr:MULTISPECIES: N-acetyltransferase [unclassified Roseitalea]
MIINKTVFRPSSPEDAIAVRAVHRRAFGRDAEAELAIALIEGETETIDMVAKLDSMVVGHVVLSALDGPERSLALGPLAVDPDWRDFKIGTELVRRALEMARRQGWKSAFVLGDPVYYGRFGFKRALAEPVTCAYQGPYLQALELSPGALADYAGPVTYPAPFHAVD